MLALSTTQSPISEIVTLPQGHEGLLPMCTFVATTREAHHLGTSFTKLRKLRLSLTVERIPNDPLRGLGSGGIVAKAMCAAINLESLVIEVSERDDCYEPTTMVCEILGGCQFAKLRSLILLQMSSMEQELIDFLGGSRSLEHLSFDDCTISRGTWESTARKIPEMLDLKTVMIKKFYEEILRRYPDQWRDNDYCLVNDFFFGHGRNPFTLDSCKQFQRLDSGAAERINAAMTGEARYRLHH